MWVVGAVGHCKVVGQLVGIFMFCFEQWFGVLNEIIQGDNDHLKVLFVDFNFRVPAGILHSCYAYSAKISAAHDES